MSDLTPIPARIHLQVRDGALNVLSEFEVEVAESTPNPETGRIEHKASVHSIIKGLSLALRGQVDLLLADADTPGNREWLQKMHAWIVREEGS